MEANTRPDFSVRCLKWEDIFLSLKGRSQILLALFNCVAAVKCVGEFEFLLLNEDGGIKLCLWPMGP